METLLNRILQNQVVLLCSIHGAVPSSDVEAAIKESCRLLDVRARNTNDHSGQFGSSGTGQQAYSTVDVQR